MASWNLAVTLVTLFACNGPTEDKTPSTTDPSTPTGDSGDSTTITAHTATTGDTAPTDTALAPPSWTDTLLQRMAYADETAAMGAVFAIDDEVWLMWEIKTRDRADALILERHIEGQATERVTVSTTLKHPTESVLAALRGHSDWNEVIVQKRVECSLATFGVCPNPPSEQELVFIDRTSMATRIEPLVLPALQGLEKGRGSFDVNADGLLACFKGYYGGPAGDEVQCVERDRLGNLEYVEITPQSPGADDHPSVALRGLDGRRYVAFTSNRGGPRATMLATDDSVVHMHDPAIRSEDAMLAQTADGELVLTWSETRASEGALVAATCTEADCRDASAWTLTDVEAGPNKISSPSVAIHEGRPVVTYGSGDEVRLAIRCDEGWRVERPWDHGNTQTQRGQASVSGSTKGILHIMVTETDPKGVMESWWGQRTGALCPEQ